MNGRELLEAMSFIDDELLAASEKPVKKAVWKQWTAVAACLCVLVLGAFSFLTMGRGGATEGAAEEIAAFSAAGTADQAAPESAEEPEAMAETGAETGVRGAAMTARVEVLELTAKGFTARVLECDLPLPEETVTVILADGFQPEITVGEEYTVCIDGIDNETGALLVYDLE